MFALYMRARTGEATLTTCGDRRSALLELLDAGKGEMIINDAKLDALDDDELEDAVRDQIDHAGDIREWSIDEVDDGVENETPRVVAAPASPRAVNAEGDTRAALARLVEARDLLKRAGVSERCLARVRLAISSVKGAVRHAPHRRMIAAERMGRHA